MAYPDIPAALVVLQTHLEAAAATITGTTFAVDRGIVTSGRQLRYYWDGECPPPRMGATFDVLNGRMVGQMFTIAAMWPLTNLTPALAAATDVEMELLAGQIRTRLQGDNDLGGNIDNLDLGYAQATLGEIGNARFVILQWELAMAYVEYPLTR